MRARDDNTIIVNPRERLGEMLVEEGIIRQDQLQEALAKQGGTGKFIGQILVELGYVPEQDLAAFLVRQCRIPHLNLLDYEIKQETLELVPYEICRDHRVLPVDKLGSMLTVAMVDPFDNVALEKIRGRTGLKVKPVLCNWYDFELVFGRLYAERRIEGKRDAHEAQPGKKPTEPKHEGRTAAAIGETAGERGNAPTGTIESPDIERPQVEKPEELGQPQEVGVPLEEGKPVLHVVRAARVAEFRDTETELPVPEYTFENFFVGRVNTFTYAIARAVADAPGTEYNPFFIYGDVGLGKTHLVCAIGNESLAARPGSKVLYNSAGTFSNRLIEAIQRHDVASFREHYQRCDMVIVDDIQFLAGRERAQEEFFEIFNALHNEHKQIIVASDKPPEELDALEKRLVSRFAGGIVAGIAAPEWETRMAILKHLAQVAKCEVPEEVLSLIATRVPDDVRKLSGALRKIVAFCELVQQEITVELAQEVLDHLFEKRRPGRS